MSIWGKDLYETLLYSSGTRNLSYRFVTADGGEADLLWGECKASVDYYVESNFIEDGNNEARFFVLADYVTYIPYGAAGYAAFGQMLRESGSAKSVWEFRYARLKKHLDKVMPRVSQAQSGIVRSFFEEYNKDCIDLKNLSDVALLFCRFHHECEARYRTAGFINYMDISKVTDAFARKISCLVETETKISAKEYLSAFPAIEPLSARQISFLRSSLL